MTDPPALGLALVVLGVVLAVAVLRPRYVPEPAAAGVGAIGLVLLGAIDASRAGEAVRALAPTVGFLAALLLLAEGCRRDGLFEAVGRLLARRSRRQPRRLLALVFAVASAITIVLGLDATVVLLTPVVIVTASRMRTSPKAHVYACAHLANSASLLLPVSNLTNLLAFRASGLPFTRFALLMVLPTLAAVSVDWIVLARWVPRTRADNGPAASGSNRGPRLGLGPGVSGRDVDGAEGLDRPLPCFSLVVLTLTLVGFGLSSGLRIAPVWVAVVGAAAITAPAAVARETSIPQLVRALQPGFLVFVLGLGVIVAAAASHGLTAVVKSLLPGGASLLDLLSIAIVSAVLANLLNNLPATLILVPVAARFGAGPVLAVLIGVDVGPNLTEVGSLATLLWRRVLKAEGVDLRLGELMRLGAVTVPPALVSATALLWLSLKVV